MRRVLPFAIAIFLAGCGGATNTPPTDPFDDLVNEINAQHPPLYDGTNTVLPPADRAG